MNNSDSKANKKQQPVLKDQSDDESYITEKRSSYVESRKAKDTKGKGNIKYNFKVNNDSWQNANFCFLCERKFNKIKYPRHHCRLCGKSCCDDCSKKRITKNRVCDICFMKHTNEKVELQKKSYLKQLSSWTKELSEKIKMMRKQVTEKEKQRDRLIAESDDNNRQMILRISDLEKNLQNLKTIYDSKVSEKASLEEAIKTRKTILNESESKLRELDNKVVIMGLSVDDQKSKYEMQLAKRDALRRHLQDLINSEENFRQAHDEDDNKIGVIDGLITTSALLREGDERTIMRLSTLQRGGKKTE